MAPSSSAISVAKIQSLEMRVSKSRNTSINASSCGCINVARVNRHSSSTMCHYHFIVCFIVTMVTTLITHESYALQPQPSQSKVAEPTVQGLRVHRTPLRRRQQQDEPSPYCFVLSSMLDVPTRSNILATQVWPSARVAATTLEELIINEDSDFSAHSNSQRETKERVKFTVCELGCGPGLPSLAAALLSNTREMQFDLQVIATDVDEFALDLVNSAATEQGLNDIISTRVLDLIEAGREDWDEKKNNAWINDVDLFVMADVFESSDVAIGAARLTQRVLSLTEDNRNERGNQRQEVHRKPKRVLVFAQTDRSQREVYLEELQKNLSLHSSSLAWKPPELYGLEERLWLCDVDETLVKYG